ncbi:MAG: deoxyribose-phosphate aldolase [Oscillospiraceae bacterium]|nr:deoxyribose-phosphate aldolase [Oscillospiraceae bacterium]
MDIEKILSSVDHTNLSPAATLDDIISLCGDGLRFRTASVCIPPCYVREAADYVAGRLPICTVAGFPTGYSTTQAKCFETAEAVKKGADEIDIVINVGLLKAGQHGRVLDDIREVKKACSGRLLKVIIETCLLTRDEKITMCGLVSESGAEYIKTSTGFSSGGATREDVALLKAHVAPHVKIKAAGGIRTLTDAEDFLNLGANRLGTSAIVKLVKEDAAL